MSLDDALRARLHHTLDRTDLDGLGARVQGKVRDVYLQPALGRRVLVTTDRLSAFDRVITTIPCKGQVLNQLAAWWFQQVADIVDHHVLAVPDPHVTVGREAEPLPVEIVVRGYLTGVTDTSLWTRYARGDHRPYGLDLPPGLRENDALPTPVVTPTTKGAAGEHDRPTTGEEIVASGLISAGAWAEIERVALALYQRGAELAAKAGLILVDTKYEMGWVDGRLCLIDEIHTPDSSRYWIAGQTDDGRPVSLDKEVVRRWLKSVGYAGEGPPPVVPDEVRLDLARRYIEAYERLTGETFAPAPLPHEARLRGALAPWRLDHGGGDDVLDRPKEECGVVGIWSLPDAQVDVARLMFFCLFALQHRGQESAGICTSDGALTSVHRGMGLVSQVFTEQAIGGLRGHFGVGHNRYSTTGASHLSNAQPYVVQTLHGALAVGHNGNLTNADALRRHLMERGVGLTSTSDTEVITQFLAMPPPFQSLAEPQWERRLASLMEVAEGAYSLVVQTQGALWAMRDPLGMRPLCVGHLKENGRIVAWLVASESCALLTIGAKVLREIEPGEIVRIDGDGITTVRRVPRPASALCVFEHVYFARPDSIMHGRSVQVVRAAMGRQLAREAPAAADLVFGVPDSSIAAAMAFGEELGLPYREGLIKNRYIGRTFIQPTPALRRDSVRLKYNALRENLEGKRVVLIDDSIVRGTTMGPIVRLVREAGKAREVHVRIASPPVRHPCFMGVDLASYDQLIAHHMDVEAIGRHVGADSLAYLSVEGMHAAVASVPGTQNGHCDACFSGRYPVDVSACLAK